MHSAKLPETACEMELHAFLASCELLKLIVVNYFSVYTQDYHWLISIPNVKLRRKRQNSVTKKCCIRRICCNTIFTLSLNI